MQYDTKRIHKLKIIGEFIINSEQFEGAHFLRTFGCLLSQSILDYDFYRPLQLLEFMLNK